MEPRTFLMRESEMRSILMNKIWKAKPTGINKVEDIEMISEKIWWNPGENVNHSNSWKSMVEEGCDAIVKRLKSFSPVYIVRAPTLTIHAPNGCLEQADIEIYFTTQPPDMSPDPELEILKDYKKKEMRTCWKKELLQNQMTCSDGSQDQMKLMKGPCELPTIYENMEMMDIIQKATKQVKDLPDPSSEEGKDLRSQIVVLASRGHDSDEIINAIKDHYLKEKEQVSVSPSPDPIPFYRFDGPSVFPRKDPDPSFSEPDIPVENTEKICRERIGGVGMKDDEFELLALIKLVGITMPNTELGLDIGVEIERPMVRDIVTVCRMNEKRACYILEKWHKKGWYKFGTGIMGGWLEKPGLEALEKEYAKRTA